jgi:hypothetical protein
MLRLAVQGWRDAFVAGNRMRVLVGESFAFVFVLDLAAAACGLNYPDGALLVHSPLQFLLSMALLVLFTILYYVVLTPLAMAVIRHVVLGRMMQRYSMDLLDVRFRRFAGLAILLNLLGIVIGMWAAISFTQIWVYISHEFVLWPMAITWALFISAFIICNIVAVRTAILFPAIAVDSQRASWRNAVLDTKGHSWTIFFSFLFAYLPVLLLNVALYHLAARVEASLAGRWTYVPVNSLLTTVTTCIFAAVAARTFLEWANKLGRPSVLPANGT